MVVKSHFMMDMVCIDASMESSMDNVRVCPAMEASGAPDVKSGEPCVRSCGSSGH